MAVYLIDSEVLGQIVDSIISEKTQGKIPSEFREKAMLALDNQILRNILGSLTKEQGQELNAILDKDDPEAIENFFKSHNIDLEKILQNTMVKFKKDFLEGSKNA